MDRRITAVSSLLLTSGLAACLWGAASIGGTLTGLPNGASVVLQNNSMDNLTLTANGAFEFARTIDIDEQYSVTVLTQPTGANCTVANGSGTIGASGRDVTNVAVTCTPTGSITGTVSGLTGGTSVTLLNNGNALVVATNGAFSFSGGILAAGTAYSVTVGTQPSGLTCTVTNGSGTVVTGTATNITVACS